MNAALDIGRFLCRLHEDRISISLDGSQILVEGPHTNEFLEEIRERKPVLIALLRTPPDQLPDDWRRLLYRLHVVEDEEELHYHDRRA